MKLLLLFITLYFVLGHYGEKIVASISDNKDPDVYRNISEMITSKGYPVEEHTVQTADGYLLSLVRLPYGRKSDKQRYEKKTILLIHGILLDATTWVINFPDQSLGFVLADENYDVWLLSTRGSYYSKRHITYDTSQRKFWNFSFQELSQYDVPATIDYILENTGKDSLYVIAYSQGVPATTGTLSEMPDYNKKVKLLVAIAPVPFFGNVKSPFRLLAPVKYTFAFVNDLFTHGEFIIDSPLLKIFKGEFCVLDDLELCENILFAFAGVDRAQLNESRIEVYSSRFITSTSTKSFVHFLQLSESKKYRKYDYGRRRNLIYYQQEEPPDYDLSRVTVPVAVIWSTNDLIAAPKDVDIFRKHLNSLVFYYRVPYPYNHADYVLAKNSVKLINEPILKLLAEY